MFVIGFYHVYLTIINKVWLYKKTTHREAIISEIRTGQRRISSARTVSRIDSATRRYGRCELDSHADTIVAGSNCVILQYTGKECDVTPYREDYESIKGVPIVNAATAWQSPHTGQTYILVLNESLWMGDSMDHSLINPNQLRHFGTRVQDDPTSSYPLSVITEDNEFCMELSMEGTIVYANTHSPSEYELNTCPHINLSSPQPWNPMKVKFPRSNITLEEVVGGMRYVSGVTAHHEQEQELIQEEHDSFCLESINRAIASMKTVVQEESSHIETPLTRDESIDPGTADLPVMNTFQSSDRHSDVTPNDLSERWGISIATATKTLKKTTQRFLRSAVLPLARRYRADRVFTRKTLAGDWSTDTMDGRCKSLEGNRYAQVFANKAYFSRIYPMDSKSKAGDALRLFCQEFGVPEKLTFDGSKEQTGKGTEFMRQIRTHDISYHVSEPDLHNQNPVEGVVREIRRKWYRIMIRKRVPEAMWDYGMKWVTETSSLTHTSAGSLEGCIPLTQVTGDTADISEYLDFGFYDEVWYKDNAGSSPYEPGRWLGVSHRTGRLMCYHILTHKGTVVSRSTVQRVTNLEKTTASVKDTFQKFDENIRVKLKTIDRGYIGDKPNPEDWADLMDEDEDFREEFQNVYNNKDIPEADDFTPEVLEDTYVNMEIALPRDGEGPEFARVTKRLRDANGIPIGTANDNPILDTRVYEVEYLDGHKASLAANTIAENMFAQVDEEGNRFVLMDSIADHRVDGHQLGQEEAFIKSGDRGRRRRETTKGWEILVQWKDGSTSWEALKDIKESYPVQMAEYAVQRRISQEPAFAWWVPHVLKKKDRIIAKVKSKYWQRTHKFGIRIPKSVEEARRLDRENGNTLWWDAICQEMKNVRIAFEEYYGDTAELPPGYQRINCHMIFDVKMGENFRRKARMVAGGHVTETPSTLTYSSVVSRDSVRIALTIAALNGLKVLVCDIQNAYLTAPCREKIWTVAGPEFGPEDQGKNMLVVRALYGLKSSGAAFRSFLAETLHDMGFSPSVADPDVWLRPAIKENGFKYWEYILCYVDDVLCISHKPDKVLQGIASKFKLKDDKMAEPDVYLGAEISKMDNEQGHECWAMSSDKYCAAMVKNVEDVLQKKGLRLPSKCTTPLQSGYKPELDCTGELKAEGLQWYQEMIGSLRWAIELGRVDILLEVSIMSKHLAMPREGHLEQVLHIMGYIKQHKKLRLMFDCGYPKVDERWFKEYDWFDFYRDAKEAIPPNMPEARGHSVIITCFVDANHAGNVIDRKSQTGILIFLNKAPIHWYSKRQATVETSTFGAEFCAMRIATEMIESLRYKLRMFGIPIDGAANVFCDNEAVYKNTVIPESTLKKKHHSIAYHKCREAVAAGTIRVAKQGTTKNLADLFTKVLTTARRVFLLERFTY
jgi:hypothetical protein